jgi:hypothetical protein
MSAMKTSEVEREVTEAVHWQSGHWGAVMAFCGMLMAMAETEALLIVNRGWGLDIWTVVNRSSPGTRRQLAEKQWNFMQVFPDLDVDFHILDRRDEPMETFVRPSDYDMFIKLKSNAHSNTAQATS